MVSNGDYYEARQYLSLCRGRLLYLTDSVSILAWDYATLCREVYSLEIHSLPRWSGGTLSRDYLLSSSELTTNNPRKPVGHERHAALTTPLPFSLLLTLALSLSRSLVTSTSIPWHELLATQINGNTRDSLYALIKENHHEFSSSICNNDDNKIEWIENWDVGEFLDAGPGWSIIFHVRTAWRK